MLPKFGNPNYRYYNCNLQAPKVLCNELTTTNLNENGLTVSPSRILRYNGVSTQKSTHVFTPIEIPSLGKSVMSGTLTMYLVNDVSGESNVSLAMISKTTNLKLGNSPLNVLLYQRYGNFTTVEIPAPTSTQTTTFQVNVSPPAIIYWRYEGL